MRRRVIDAFLRWLSGRYHHVTPGGALASAMIGAAFAGAAFIGVGWALGFWRVFDLLQAAHWSWLAVAVGCVVLSHLAYTFAYREVVRAEGGPTVSFGRMALAVTAGFGLLTPRSGFTLDWGMWSDHGLAEAEARERVAGLAMLEYALLVPATLASAILLFVVHYPALDAVLPSWIVGVPAGTVVSLGLYVAYRRRWLNPGRLASLRRAFEGGAGAARLLASRLGILAAFGMALYWAADITALGACLAIVLPVPISIAALIVAYATGYSLTRRSLPLAGVGVTEALLPFAMVWMTVPLGAALIAVFFYRLCNLWLPLAPAMVSMRHLQTHLAGPPAAGVTSQAIVADAAASGAGRGDDPSYRVN